MTAGAALTAGVVLLGACSSSVSDDPCGDAPSTCVRVTVTSFFIETIDELELDLVYNDHHSTTTTGTRGTPLDLPTDTAVVVDLPASSVIELNLIAVAKLNGVVLGGDASSSTVQQGHTGSMFLDLDRFSCTEHQLYCASIGPIFADYPNLYRCTGGVPIYYATCSSGCRSRDNQDATCFGGGLCRDGGTYCGGHSVEGDPFTLYVCRDFGGTSPVLCPNGCAVHGDGDDACR